MTAAIRGVRRRRQPRRDDGISRRCTMAGRALFLATGVLFAASTGAAAGDAMSGSKIAERWCAACHVVSGTRPGRDSAPSFPEIANRTPARPDSLKNFLADPHPPMPDFSLTRREIDDLAAYIATLRRR